MSDTITHFGLFIPINLMRNHPARKSEGLDNPPIPEPEPDNVTLVRWGEGWGIFWTLADEEDMAPDAGSSVNWLMSAAEGVGRRHIMAHGYQYGEPVVVCVTADVGDPLPDFEGITRHDWTSKLSPP